VVIEFSVTTTANPARTRRWSARSARSACPWPNYRSNRHPRPRTDPSSDERRRRHRWCRHAHRPIRPATRRLHARARRPCHPGQPRRPAPKGGHRRATG